MFNPNPNPLPAEYARSSTARKKWLEKVSLHHTAWELLRGLLKPVAANCLLKSVQS